MYAGAHSSCSPIDAHPVENVMEKVVGKVVGRVVERVVGRVEVKEVVEEEGGTVGEEKEVLVGVGKGGMEEGR